MILHFRIFGLDLSESLMHFCRQFPIQMKMHFHLCPVAATISKRIDGTLLIKKKS